jgi:hypothetical protein
MLMVRGAEAEGDVQADGAVEADVEADTEETEK